MNTIIKLIITFFLGLIGTISQAQDLAGSWKGTLTVQGTEVEMIYNFTNNNNQIDVTLDIPMQGLSGFSLDGATLDQNKVSITSKKLQLSYSGTLEGKEIKGTYSQAGQSYPLNLIKTEKTIPGNSSLPSTKEDLAKIAALETGDFKYSVEDFYKMPEASNFKLSPDGSYISYFKRNDEGKRDLYVKNVQNQTETLVAAQKEDVILGYSWATNDRILFTQDRGGNQNYHIFGVDIDGKNKKELTPYEGVKASIVKVLRDDPDHIIIEMNKDNKKQEEPYKLNIKTATLEKLYTHQKDEDPIPSGGYIFDKNGVLRSITHIKNGVDFILDYKIDNTYTTIANTSVTSGEGLNIITFNYQTPYPHDAYIVSNLNTDKYEIQLFDLKKNKKIKTILANAIYDAANLSISKKRNYEVDYTVYNGAKVEVIPVSKTYKKVMKRLKKEFGDRQFYTSYKSNDENIYMVTVTSDKIVGEYYIYNVKEDSITLLYKVLPHLKEKDLAPMKPISFISRDGFTIHGYITLPKEALKGKKVPAIIYPHGGPQGVRDSWGFIADNQLFASRGYATININFRISGGYGKEFTKAGFKQIGRNVMNDLEDGLAYVIEQGWVDQEKVAIFGVSHGGYAVLRGLTKTPNLYACGIDYVGVSNLNTFMNTIPAYWEKYREWFYATWYNPNDPKEQTIMDEISPSLHTDKIIKPLFVIQGANDPRVNIDESDQIVSKLRNRGIEVPYMVKYDEGHGFYKENNRIELYRTIMGFLASNLK
ncbi:S9 family peptidase [Aquimarina sp. SS2-1]|uniref:S9 family peptidase n=1 Tax=Aquimarina besae TaxID=3342247 RepID=UPI00366B09E7